MGSNLIDFYTDSSSLICSFQNDAIQQQDHYQSSTTNKNDISEPGIVTTTTDATGNYTTLNSTLNNINSYQQQQQQFPLDKLQSTNNDFVLYNKELNTLPQYHHNYQSAESVDHRCCCRIHCSSRYHINVHPSSTNLFVIPLVVQQTTLILQQQ